MSESAQNESGSVPIDARLAAFALGTNRRGLRNLMKQATSEHVAPLPNGCTLVTRKVKDGRHWLIEGVSAQEYASKLTSELLQADVQRRGMDQEAI